MKHTNQDLRHQGFGHTSPNNLIIVKDPWSGKQSDQGLGHTSPNPWK